MKDEEKTKEQVINELGKPHNHNTENREVTIIAVDDVPENLFTYKKVIKHFLPEVKYISTTSAVEGLKMASDYLPDCLLIDVNMPEMDGITLCKKLKSNKNITDIPVILITGYETTPQFRAKGIEAGADDFITKPYDNVDFIAKIKVMIRIKHYEDKLRLINVYLDKLVEKRTADLSMVNEQLRNKIIEHTQAEEALQKIGKEQELILNSVPASLWYKDKENRFLRVNKAGIELVGLKPEDIIGKTAYEIFPEEADHYFKDDLEVMKSGKPKLGIIEQLQVNSGEKIWVQTDKIPIKDEQGNITGILVIVVDITERKKAVEELREKDEFNFALFQHNPIETIITDLEGRVVKCNIAKKKSGDRIPNIGDVMFRDYAGKHEIDMYTEMLECIRTGKSKEFPERKYGDRFLAINIAPFPQGAIITSQDITKRKDLGKSLKISESELKKEKLALEQKTIALKEVIGEIEEKNNKIKDDITTNVKEVLLPILERLGLGEPSNKYIDLLRHHLEKIISSFGRKITTNNVNLTPREIEICTMVESGLTNKEISRLLSISCHTVETHRNSIREKFNITNKNINLSSFLQQL